MEDRVVLTLNVVGINAQDLVILDLVPPLPAHNLALFPGLVVTHVVHRVTLLPVQTHPVLHRSRYLAHVGTGRQGCLVQTMHTQGSLPHSSPRACRTCRRGTRWIWQS